MYEARAVLPRTGVPFVLLDDARAGGRAHLYLDPVDIVTVNTTGKIGEALERVRAGAVGGLHAAGYLAYEAGHALQPGAVSRVGDTLLWFGLFRDRLELDAATLLPSSAGGWSAAPRPALSRNGHADQLGTVQELITAGDVYQANLTFGATVDVAGDPLALYAGLRARARAGYGGIVFTGTEWLLSLSPELFFELDDGVVATRPMKGTAARVSDPRADAAAAAALATDTKQRAENLMIVDLLRNDLAKVAVPGSVAVPRLFEVETYPTIHHLTSTVTGRLAAGKDAVDVLVALFPCGSVTGAPKKRAMEVIEAVEQGPRGVYTGSIGRIDAGGRSAAFNVAIRTLRLPAGSDIATMGLGSGIVADSRAEEEWSECRAKGGFVASDRRFDLIETLAFDPNSGVQRLDAHLDRMKASAALFGFVFDRHRARNELQAATFRVRKPARIRLLLAKSGAFASEVRDLPPLPAGPVDVVLLPQPVVAADFRLHHKTTDRGFYERRRPEAFEAVYVDGEGYLTEGGFTNVFVERDGVLLTPPLARGVLPGILRGALIDEGRAKEAELTPADLVEGFFIGNAVRGLLPARLLRL